MAIQELSKYKNHILLVILVILSLFVLWIRLLPLIHLGNADPLTITGSDDPLYKLRETEQIIRNFPANGYAWFDPMTLFPTGQNIHWGPLMVYLGAGLCLLVGATTRPEMTKIALLVLPVLAAVMVPIVFLLVRRISDWKSAIIASFFVAIISGQFFFRSIYGYYDHEFAETFFSTLFILAYVWCMWSGKEKPVDITKKETLKKPIILAILAGITFSLGLFNMPTMVLFALIVAAFTVIQFTVDFYRDQPSDYLLVTNIITFGTAAAAFFIVGVHTPGFDLSHWTIAHPIVYALLALGTLVLYMMAKVLKGKKAYYLPAAIIAIGIGGICFFALVFPALFSTLIFDLSDFFIQNSLYVTIQEAKSWTFDEAWAVFNYGLILMAGGFAVIGYRIWKHERPDLLVVLIWSLVMLFATCEHIRYEYYFAANIVVLAGLCVGYVVDSTWRDIVLIIRPGSRGDKNQEPVKKPLSVSKGKKVDRKPKVRAEKGPNYLKVGLLGLAILLSILFMISSVPEEYAVATSGGLTMNQDWREALEWMSNHTPDPSVDYYKVYDQATFHYPPGAYGVMSWWDYGHLITYIAKRIPNANPFQAGVAGPNGAAAFFMSQSEDNANQILANDGTRYIVTDIEMDTSKFWAMATWYNTTIGVAPYQSTFLMPSQSNPNQVQGITVLAEPYYQTMVSKLHNFDGSMTDPSKVVYIEYKDPTSSIPYPVITSANLLNYTNALSAVSSYNGNAQSGTHATIVNTMDTIYLPLSPIPALRHYRLVHESPRNVYSAGGPDVKFVKVFEFVQGAHIKGDGIIEIPLVTNTGRTFTYRQASSNGEFIVPYSTTGNPYEVKATGKYHITGTDKQFDVPEEAVMKGEVVSG